jgi:hypothetical protein
MQSAEVRIYYRDQKSITTAMTSPNELKPTSGTRSLFPAARFMQMRGVDFSSPGARRPIKRVCMRLMAKAAELLNHES